MDENEIESLVAQAIRALPAPVLDAIRDGYGPASVTIARAAITAHRAALAAAGLVIAPKEPTEAMIEAIRSPHRRPGWSDAGYVELVCELFGKMIAAAPD